MYGSADGFKIRHTRFELSIIDNPIESLTISASTSATQETTWKYPSRTASLPATFFWHKSVLYAAVGAPNVKLLRFPDLAHNESSSSAIQALNRKLHIPCSSYQRNLKFSIIPDENEDIVASFSLDSALRYDLPSVNLEFTLCSKDWTDYDPNDPGDELSGCSSDFLKGVYASREQAFSVPIRSGWDWRRSVYVTCW